MKILTDDRWLYRAILAIYDRQNDAEKSSDKTIEDNSIGFSGVDAKILSQFAKDLKKYSTLLQWKKDVARRKMVKYSHQLYNIAKAKEATR